MQLAQRAGIDLPLKVLVYEAGKIFLSYSDPACIARRHGIGEAAKPAVEAMSGALKEMAAKSTTAP
jgi:uncharacterized protein (DUF302 family)